MLMHKDCAEGKHDWAGRECSRCRVLAKASPNPGGYVYTWPDLSITSAPVHPNAAAMQERDCQESGHVWRERNTYTICENCAVCWDKRTNQYHWPNGEITRNDHHPSWPGCEGIGDLDDLQARARLYGSHGRVKGTDSRGKTKPALANLKKRRS